MKKFIILLMVAFFMFNTADAKKRKNKDLPVQTESHINNAKVYKHTLENGLTVLVYPSKRIPKVMVSIWYNVGSKDEKDAEKGIAHLIEHMIFKGNGDTITEPDIPMLAHKLSASTNAATSYDYTNYYFSLPTHNWKEVLPVLADVMVNAAFDDQQLNSEMKAVIQELKMRRENYFSAAFFELVGMMFPDHPYHYPVIGFKQDLWNLFGKNLKDFYKKHYVPNNATVVITGDVDPQDVFGEAQKYLGHIKSNPAYKKEQFYANKDLISKSVTIYRAVQHPMAVLAFAIPGAQEKLNSYFDVLELLFGNLKSSRLYKKLVDDLKLVTMIGSGDMDLFEHGVFYVYFQPSEGVAVSEIEKIILEELESIARCGISESELNKAIKQARKQYYNLFENINQQAQQIGRAYLATNDENHVFNYLQESPEVIGAKIQELTREYLRPSVMHKGMVLPLPPSEREHWLKMQKESDDEDTRFLTARARTTPLQKSVYTEKINVHEPAVFDFPKAEKSTLSNGIKVFTHHNGTTPKVDIVLEFKAKSYYEPEEKQGLYNFMTSLMDEGTKNYSAAELSEELDSRGINITIAPGMMVISVLKEDLEDGLKFALEMLTNATFPEKEVEKIRAQIFVAIKNFWDEPKQFIRQLINDQVYAGHPWSKNRLGSKESIAAITRDDIIAAYKKFISPDGAKIAIVGDIKDLHLASLLEKYFGKWKGQKVADIEYPVLKPLTEKTIQYPIDRDQTVLAFVGNSIDRKHPDYDKLILFDQIFGTGALGSMHSRLFALREATGLFYTINGSTLSAVGEQPGMVSVMTIVSNDRLKEAEKVIKEVIDTVAPTITPQELIEARHAIANSLMNNFESNLATANAFLAKDKYDLPDDYFDTRNENLSKISLQDVMDTAAKYLHTNKMATFKVGRAQE